MESTHWDSSMVCFRGTLMGSITLLSHPYALDGER